MGPWLSNSASNNFELTAVLSGSGASYNYCSVVAGGTTVAASNMLSLSIHHESRYGQPSQ